MTNQEIIKKKFEAFRQKVHQGGTAALCDQMSETLGYSLNLHETLKGKHKHHLTESDTHGWAVADQGAVVGSGASRLAKPSKNGSAEEDARQFAATNSAGVQVGVFSANMADPFDKDGKPKKRKRPYYDFSFETTVHEMLRNKAATSFPEKLRKNIKAVVTK